MGEGLSKDRHIVLIDAQWHALAKARGLHTPKALAGALGISEVTLWRIRKGHGYPGEQFMTKAMWLFFTGYDIDGNKIPAKFEDLFEIRDVA
jgi:hypothetical protein